MLDPNISLWAAASVGYDAPAVNRNGIKTLLANGLSTFPIKDNPGFNSGPKSLPDCFKSAILNFVAPVAEEITQSSDQV